MDAHTDAHELKSGWYAIGVKDVDGEVDWACAPIYKYLGCDYWTDEDGEQVEVVFDPVLQMQIPISHADVFVLQNV